MIANVKGLACLLSFVTMVLGQCAYGQGDYSHSIGGGYEFVRCNSVETVVCDTSSNVVFTPKHYVGVGPILKYAHSNGYLLLFTAGREIREAGRFESADFSKRYCFAISRSVVDGPFLENEFEIFLEREKIKDVRWISVGGFSFAMVFAVVLVSIAVGLLLLLILLDSNKRGLRQGKTKVSENKGVKYR